MRRSVLFVLALLLLTLGRVGNSNTGEQTGPVVDLDPDDPSILERPFTADEIRDEWIPGLILMLRRTGSEGVGVERWTVLKADDEGVDIESVDTDDNGNATGEPKVNHSTWFELRDHATFAADRSTREWVSRSTTLGVFDGWLYRVSDPDADTMTEFFFVPTLPGAPVQMRIFKKGTVIFELEQIIRMRPTAR